MNPPAPVGAPGRAGATIGSRRAHLILATCCGGLLLVSVDATIVNIALPSIGQEFGSSVSVLQWTVDAYLIVLASLLLVGLQLNVVLMIFNLLPIPPLDGSHVLRHALTGGAAELYEKVEAYGGILLLVLVFTGVTSIIIRPVMGVVTFFLYL